MVSIIITTYKRPVDILEKAICSVKNQTYQEWELIIVNDYPNDDKLVKSIQRCIEEYNDNRIRYVVHDKNKGACVARNTGIRLAKGEFIAFLDDDDEWCTDKLEKIIPYFNKSNVGLVYSDVYFVYPNKTKYHKNTPNHKYKNNPFKALLINNYIGSTSFPVMTKKAVIESGMFNADMKACQDLDLWLRISKKFHINYCPIALTKYYFSDECITKNINNRIESHEKIISKYNKEYVTDKALLHKKYLNIAADALLTNEYSVTKNYLNKSLKLKYNNISDYLVVIKSLLIVIKRKLCKIN